jgi:hypothetical protein
MFSTRSNGINEVDMNEHQNSSPLDSSSIPLCVISGYSFFSTAVDNNSSYNRIHVSACMLKMGARVEWFIDIKTNGFDGLKFQDVGEE